MQALTRGLLTTVFVAGLATGAAAQTKWDMPTPYGDGTFHTKNVRAFAEDVKKATDGKLDITVHSAGSLVKHPEIKASVRRGVAPIGELLISLHANESPIYSVDSVPFLATSFEDADRLWKAAEPAYQQLLDEQNLVLLYTVLWPAQGLYLHKEATSVDDLEGVKFRSYNPTTARVAELTGMLPVQIEQAEISQAFATGVADSMISSGSTGYDSKIWEHVSNFYTVDAWLPRNTIVANKAAWNGLDEATRKAMGEQSVALATSPISSTIPAPS